MRYVASQNGGMYRKAISGLLIISLSVGLLWHFSNIWRFGEYLIQEPNKVILIGETAFLVGILVFGLCEFIGALKND
uniref:Uncharacterized protein n=1 Tax=viral metagenome TaxID=1070528 RepID=A0A6M3JHB0_9ZZZZ